MRLKRAPQYEWVRVLKSKDISHWYMISNTLMNKGRLTAPRITKDRTLHTELKERWELELVGEKPIKLQTSQSEDLMLWRKISLLKRVLCAVRRVPNILGFLNDD
jgi:hypothetical protein